jgi:purine-cytosine permease-like protein
VVNARGDAPKVGGVEVRSIDYVPLDERRGRLSDLGPLWLMSNAQIATLAVGLISITSGGNLIWSLIAIISGTLIGTFFMAFHSAQGPQLGLPQMIQSRPQFGYVGALLVWLFAYLQYAGFNIFNTVLGARALDTTVHGGTKLWIVIVTAVAFVIALVGYDLIHRFERYLAYGFLLVFGVFTVGALVTLDFPAGAFSLGDFSWTPFLAQFGVVAGYQISAIDSFRQVRPTLTVRIATIAFTAALSLIGALGASENFLGNFESFLLLVLYLFIPWTAVNLVDYFIVRRGHYAIAEIFNPHGMYGRWGWRGIVSYLVGFAVMVPFFSTGQFTGFVAGALGGADLSLFLGLPVAGVLYYVLGKSIDVAAETRIAEAEAAQLEAAAHRHETLGS